MKLKLLALATIFGLGAQAMAHDGHHIRPQLGFQRGEVGIGVDYENRTGNLGLGGYFFIQGDDAAKGINGVMALGAMAAVHVYDNKQLDVYVAPGFGIAKFDFATTTGDDDETTVGPVIKTGVEYNLTGQFALGMQHFFVYNWLSDDAPNSVNGLNLTATFAF